jgi:hypothetical protein
MWESRSDFQGLGEADGKPAFGFPRFPRPVLMRYASFEGWRRAFVLLPVWLPLPRYRIALWRMRRADLWSDPREEIQRVPAAAARSPKVALMHGIHAQVAGPVLRIRFAPLSDRHLRGGASVDSRRGARGTSGSCAAGITAPRKARPAVRNGRHGTHATPVPESCAWLARSTSRVPRPLRPAVRYRSLYTGS